jgi:hypothetical protein
MTTRKVISVSAKRRTTSKGIKHTEMVVYKTKLPNGKFTSQTKHEPLP